MTATTTAAARTLRGLEYWLYRYRRTWRGALVMAVFNPLIFLLAIGVGLGRIVDTTGGLPSGQPYLDFFAPGLLAASAMQTALIDSGGVVRLAAMTGGAYKAAMNSPLRPAEIFVGHLLYVGVLSALNASFFVAVLAVLGITGSPWALAMVPVGVLTGVAFAAPMAAFSIIVPNPENISQIYRFVMLPLYLFSGTFFPVETLPAAVRPLAEFLPLWHAVTLCRSLNEGTASLLGGAGHVAYLVVMAAAGLVGGRIAYRRVLHP